MRKRYSAPLGVLTHFNKRMLRLLVVLAPMIWFAVTPPARQAQKSQRISTFETAVRSFLEENCSACHSARKPSGGLDLTAFKTAESVLQEREKWELVLEKLRTGEMPPKGMPRPGEKETRAAIGWIQRAFDRADRMAQPNPGRVTARRLNRAEYNNTVRDLLGVDFKPADDFPQDDSGYGFDNIGDVLSL